MENLQEIIKRINNRKDLEICPDIESKIVYASILDTAEMISEFINDNKFNFDNSYSKIVDNCWKMTLDIAEIRKLDNDDEFIRNEFETYDIESYDSYLDYQLQTKLNIVLKLNDLHKINVVLKKYINYMIELYKSKHVDYDYTTENIINNNIEEKRSELLKYINNIIAWQCEDEIIYYIENLRRKFFVLHPNLLMNFQMNFRGTINSFLIGRLKLENLYPGYDVYNKNDYINYSDEKRRDYFNYYMTTYYELKFSNKNLDDIFNIFDEYIERTRKLLNK